MQEEQKQNHLRKDPARITVNLHYVDEHQHIGNVDVNYNGKGWDFEFWKRPMGYQNGQKEKSYPFKVDSYRLSKDMDAYDFEKFFQMPIKDSVEEHKKDASRLSFWYEISFEEPSTELCWRVFWRTLKLKDSKDKTANEIRPHV